MLRIARVASVACVGAALLAAACADQPTEPVVVEDAQLAMVTAAHHSDAVVRWHAQQAGFGRTGVVDGASASLVRNPNGVSFRLSTTGLEKGNAYTLWLVVVNNPDACMMTPCTANDLFHNPAVDSQVRFAAGSVAGGYGRGTFAGAVGEGPLSGWLAERSFDDAMGAEIHLVINDHGPMLPAHMPGMIHTYRGGCADSSPFPPPFPATALADGVAGPNTCRLYQAAIFLAP